MVEQPPSKGEREVHALLLLASLCDVWAASAVVAGSEEPTGLAQLLAVLLRLAASCWARDGES